MDYEKIMKQWDYWRKQIADGNKSSAPRDWFESVLDHVQASDNILKAFLPLNSNGGCFYCGVSGEPDNQMVHFDVDNCWNGDKKCLWHQDYENARIVLEIIKPENA